MPNQPSLSLIILHRNQVDQLLQLCQHIPSWVEEILIVDDYSESSDWKRLKNQAVKDLRIRLVRRALAGDFASQRNFALTQAVGEWSLFLDADEAPQTNFWETIFHAIQIHNNPNTQTKNFYTLIRHQFFMNQVLTHGDGGNQKIVRLGKTKLGQKLWIRKVHEVWNVPASQIDNLPAIIQHQNYTDFFDWLAKLNMYAQLEADARSESESGSLILQLLIYPLGKFLYNYLWKFGIFDGFPGLAHTFSMSYYSAILRISQYENKLKS